MSGPARTDWLLVAAAIVMTIIVIAVFVWCLWRWQNAEGRDEQRRWRRWYLISGVAAILWIADMAWSILDWASHPLNF